MAGDEPRPDGPGDLGDDDLQARASTLVDRGLERYGAGDLEGALSAWELARTLDPDHARAAQYIDYVNENYDALTSRFAARDELDVPFGLETVESPSRERRLPPLRRQTHVDSDDYDEVEVVIGEGSDERPISAPPADMASIDEGWALDEVAALPPPPSASRPIPIADPPSDFTGEDSAIRQITADLDLAISSPELELELGGAGTTQSDPATDPLELTVPPGDPQSSIDTLELGEPRGDDDAEETTAVGRKRGRGPVASGDEERGAPSAPLRSANLAVDDADEITVPGGEEPPPFSHSLSLSREAIHALQGGEEPTTERPGQIGRGFALRDLGPLDIGLIGDQLLEQAGRDVELALHDGEVSAERSAERSASRSAERTIDQSAVNAPLRSADLGLERPAPPSPRSAGFELSDDELTIERGAAHGGGGSLGDEELTVERHAPAVRLPSENDADEKTVERLGTGGELDDDEKTRERAPDTLRWGGRSPSLDLGAPLRSANLGPGRPEADHPALNAPLRSANLGASPPTAPKGARGADHELPSISTAPKNSNQPPAVIVDESLFLGEAPTQQRMGAGLTPREGDFSDNVAEFGDHEQTVERVRAPMSGRAAPPRLGAEAAAELAQRILADLERDPPLDEPRDEHIRRRVTGLIKRAELESRLSQHTTAVVALDLALDESPDSAIAQKVVHRHRDLLFDIYQNYLGDMNAIPTLALPIHELAKQDLDNRAAFLLSRVDGSLCFEEVLDVSGMTRLESYRHLCKMLLRGILEVR